MVTNILETLLIPFFEKNVFGKVYLGKRRRAKKAAPCQEKREGKITYDFVENC